MNYHKPRYRWSEKGMIFVATDLTKPDPTSVPDWARKASTGASFGNIDASDLKPPRLILLAGQSPAVMDATPGAAPGNFWLTILNQSLGKEVTGTPILLRKSYVMWAPRMPGVDQKGPLAIASDGIHWDTPNQVFEVKFPGNPKTYKWHIKNTVFETAMHKFGSSQDDNPSSKPAATLTYNVLWLIDLPDGRKQVCVFTNSRTGIAPTQNFISTTRTLGTDQFYQRYRIVVQRKTGPSGDPYFTYDYQFIGMIQDENEGKATRGLWEQYSKSGFIADMEIEEPGESQAKAKTTRATLDDDDIPF